MFIFCKILKNALIDNWSISSGETGSSKVSGFPAVLIRTGIIGSIQPLVISAITSRSPANLPPLPYLRFVYLPHAESCAHTYALAQAKHAAERQNGDMVKEANKEN